MDEFVKGRYDIILDRYLLTDLLFNPEFSENVIKAYGIPLKGSSAPMFGLGAYEFTYLNTMGITPD